MVLYNHREEHQTNTDRKDKIMKKTIKTEELLNALQEVQKMAHSQYDDPESEQIANHGYGMDDAVTMLKALLNI